MTKYQIYDNGGKTVDRYTLRIPIGNRQNEYHGFNECPFYPQGFGQYCGEYLIERSYKHLGKVISIDSLSEQAQRFVHDSLQEETQ